MGLELGVLLFGLLIAAMSGLGVVAPDRLISLLSSARPNLLEIGVGVRVVMGVVFILAAPSCRHPLVIEIFGWFALFAAAIMLAAGRERVARMLDWWLKRPAVLIRFWCVFGVAFGAYLVFAGS